VLLFVDQFEELFQFADFWSKSKLDLVSAAERRDEATMFVRALLTAMKSPLLPIHIIVSMRSEFLGRCAGFHELPEAISWSPFLVPGMTRDQREDVIRKPVQLAGGQIDARLVQRALNDTNDDPDQLPTTINPEARLAIIPAGTGDDFARGLRGERASLQSWIDTLIKATREIQVDVLYGRCDGFHKPFICLNASTMGIGGETAARGRSENRQPGVDGRLWAGSALAA
jgi:hypothetical protein